MSDDNDREFGNRPAREGFVFVCGACGKISTWRYGFASVAGFTIVGKDGEPLEVASPGWDESCMLNASEVEIERLVVDENKRIIGVLPVQ